LLSRQRSQSLPRSQSSPSLRSPRQQPVRAVRQAPRSQRGGGRQDQKVIPMLGVLMAVKQVSRLPLRSGPANPKPAVRAVQSPRSLSHEPSPQV
jgi:hypothetical protein